MMCVAPNLPRLPRDRRQQRLFLGRCPQTSTTLFRTSLCGAACFAGSFFGTARLSKNSHFGSFEDDDAMSQCLPHPIHCVGAHRRNHPTPKQGSNTDAESGKAGAEADPEECNHEANGSQQAGWHQCNTCCPRKEDQACDKHDDEANHGGSRLELVAEAVPRGCDVGDCEADAG